MKRKLNKWFVTWPEQTTVLMAVLGLLYLAVYSLQVVFADQVMLVSLLEVASLVIWLIFALDVIFRLLTSESVTGFIRSSWLEILALMIPFLRFLRMLRVLVAFRGIRPFLKTRIATTGAYVVLLLPLTWFTGAVSVLDAERGDPSALIRNLPDALWWSLSPITTVGYGELYPKTFEGKLVAGMLMVMGIALFSAGAGMFASWIMNEKKTRDDKTESV